MNCRRFQEYLYEYVEGSLPAGERAAAERHLAACVACRTAVRAEQDFAKHAGDRLRRRADGLALDAAHRRAILTAGRQAGERPGAMQLLAALWKRLAIPSTIAIATVVVACVVSSHFQRLPRHDLAISPAGDFDGQPGDSIQLSAQVPTYTFRREGNLVIDTFSYQTVAASGKLHTGQKSFPR